ncbi:MAG: glycosyltransferase family 2 protein [Acidobacteria bacterium]|nr:glycosyltransferase family 2 protein [Acidobacteriota bacterium]
MPATFKNAAVKVSVVIATYERADALRETLGSLIDQQYEDWEGIVVGDCCSPLTGEVVRSFGDPRFRYYRLPERCGEQSGPNSVGLAAARGRYVTFLNHDDLLFPDHFVRVVAAMPETGNGFVMSGAVTVIGASGTGVLGAPVIGILIRRPSFKAATPFLSDGLLEPSSSWLVDRQLAAAVGSWRPAAMLVRTPIQDWYLRAVRQGAQIIMLDQITTFYLADVSSVPSGLKLYQRSAEVNRAVFVWLRQVGADAARLEVSRQLELLRQSGKSPEPRGARHMARNAAANMAFPLFRRVGLDLGKLYLRARGHRKGVWLANVLRDRTGELLPPVRDLGELVADPERCRVF